MGTPIQPQKTPKPVTAQRPEILQEAIKSLEVDLSAPPEDPETGKKAKSPLPVGCEYHWAFVLHFLTDDFPKVAFSIWIHSRAWFILSGKTGLNVMHSRSYLPKACPIFSFIISVTFANKDPQVSCQQYKSGRRILLNCTMVMAETSQASFMQQQVSLKLPSSLPLGAAQLPWWLRGKLPSPHQTLYRNWVPVVTQSKINLIKQVLNFSIYIDNKPAMKDNILFPISCIADKIDSQLSITKLLLLRVMCYMRQKNSSGSCSSQYGGNFPTFSFYWDFIRCKTSWGACVVRSKGRSVGLDMCSSKGGLSPLRQQG